MEFLGILPFAMIVTVIAAAGFGIAAWRRRDETSGPDLGIGTTRRLYFYSVSLASLISTAVGITLVIRYLLFDVLEGQTISGSDTLLAGGAALIIVGLPIWAFHWRVVQRQVTALPVERQSLLRKFYLYVVLGVAAAMTVFSAAELLRWAFGAASPSGYHLGAFLVWAGVWAYHWQLESAEGQPTAESQTIRRLYLYVVSMVTLIMLVVGIGWAAHLTMRAGYDAIASVPVLVPLGPGLWREDLQNAVATALAGGVVWAFHWYYGARGDLRSLLRQVYLYVFAVLGGTITVLVALGTIINGVLTWALGAPGTEDAATHFRFLSAALAGLAVGGGLWAYHWSVVKSEARHFEREARATHRTYAYIMSAIGLITLAIAVGLVVSTSVGIIIDSVRDVVIGEDVWRVPVSVSITLAVLGGPLWGYYWRTIQQQQGLQAAADRMSTTRRIFTFAVLGVGMLAFLGAASTLLFFVLQDLLGTGVSMDTLEDSQVPIGIITAALVFLPYYLMQYRRDRQVVHTAADAAPAARKSVTVLVDYGSDIFVRTLETALGYRVSTMQWLDPDASFPAMTRADCDRLARQISEAAGPRVIVVPDGATLRVLSYR